MPAIDFQKLTSGRLLSNGSAQVGAYGDSDAGANPQTLYTDADLTVPYVPYLSGQQISLDLDGLPIQSNGLRVNIYIGVDYSIQLFDSVGGSVWTEARQIKLGGSFDPTSDQTITGEWDFNLDDGRGFKVADTSITKSLIIEDHGTINPTGLFLFAGLQNTVGSNNALLNMTANDDGSSGVTLQAVNSLISMGSGGSSEEVNIQALGAGGTVNITGIRTYSGYKTGTLASPPAGMVVGEEWLDTTGSAVHPQIRVSTVTT